MGVVLNSRKFEGPKVPLQPKYSLSEGTKCQPENLFEQACVPVLCPKIDYRDLVSYLSCYLYMTYSTYFFGYLCVFLV